MVAAMSTPEIEGTAGIAPATPEPAPSGPVLTVLAQRWDWAKQGHLYVPGESVGNCWSCCIGAVMQREPNGVPHFLQLYGRRYMEETVKWVEAQGYWLVEVRNGWPCTLWGGKRVLPVICCGPTVRSKTSADQHAVVRSEDGDLLYDPHPSEAGLLAVEERYLLVPFIPGAI